MDIKTFLELFQAEYHFQITLSDGTKFYLNGNTIL